jgi:hypothetical protein
VSAGFRAGRIPADVERVYAIVDNLNVHRAADIPLCALVFTIFFIDTASPCLSLFRTPGRGECDEGPIRPGMALYVRRHQVVIRQPLATYTRVPIETSLPDDLRASMQERVAIEPLSRGLIGRL